MADFGSLPHCSRMASQLQSHGGSYRNILVWVRFPHLPIEYFNRDFLMKNGARIGRPVKVDQATDQVLRGKFARLCVEVTITKPLLARFRLRR